MIYLESEEKNMDKLEQAMQSEDFWVELADTSFGEVVLHGKIRTVLPTMSIMRYQARLTL